MSTQGKPIDARDPEEVEVGVDAAGPYCGWSRKAWSNLTYRAEMPRPRVYGNEHRYKAALDRQVARGRDLLDRLDGVRNLMAAALGGPTGIFAELEEMQWVQEVERWRVTVLRSAHQYLADGATAALPTATASWPPDSGKPRHARRISWVEPWLRQTNDELQALRALLGVRRGVAATPAPNRFAELEASGLVDTTVVESHVLDMANPRTPRELANAIGAAKELAEATLRGALDRLGEPWRETDDLSILMRTWRRRVKQTAPPDPAGRGSLDSAQAALGSLLRFLAEWRNAYGRGHGRPRYPPGLSQRHARLAVDTAETTIRFIATTMDDLAMLPPEPAPETSKP